MNLEHLSLAATYEVDESFDSEKFIKMRLRICHNGENPNGSYFELEDMKRAMGSLSNIPILAHVIEDEDGNPQFGGHDMILEKSKMGDDDYKLIYLETPIGLVPESNNYVIEEHDGRNYVCCNGYVWREYSNWAEDIIERDKDVKLSMEIIVDKFEYDAKKKYFKIIDYRYQGITFLNKDYGTGMIDAMATTETFSEDAHKEKVLMMMEELKKVLSEGGNEVDGQVKEMLAEKEEVTTKETTLEEQPANETEEFTEGEETIETKVEDEPKVYVKTFEISHEDIRYALYNLLEVVEAEDNEWYFIDQVFDDRFEYSNWDMTKIYRQGYEKKGDVVSFVGDRVELFQERLTREEKEALDAMRENYALLDEENKILREFQANKLKEERMMAEEELFSQFDEKLKDNVEYQELKEKASEFTLEQLEKEVAFIMVKSSVGFKFSARPSRKNTVKIELPPKDNDLPGKFDELFDKYLKQ